jgi:catechol 2,3-dioxygenase-like lactoylglutathione lyase family enzyme
MNWTLEVAVIPVTDVDRSKAFYSDKLGFNVDVDNRMGDSFRNVQTTPPGSGCSVTFGTGLTPGLAVRAGHHRRPRGAVLARRDVTPVQHIDENGWQDGPAARGTRSSSSRTRTATTGPSRRSPRPSGSSGLAASAAKPRTRARDRPTRATIVGPMAAGSTST